MKYSKCIAAVVGFALLAAGSITRANDATTPNSGSAKAATISQHMLQKFDKNGDGALDVNELAAAITAHREHVAAKAGSTASSKSNAVPDTVRAERRIKRFDTNGDGKLNAAELQTMLSAIHARHEAHQQHVSST